MELQVKSVNHGNVFGTENWYTFYCPECGSQVVRETDTDNSCNCGQKIFWSEKSK